MGAFIWMRKCYGEMLHYKVWNIVFVNQTVFEIFPFERKVWPWRAKEHQYNISSLFYNLYDRFQTVKNQILYHKPFRNIFLAYYIF